MDIRAWIDAVDREQDLKRIKGAEADTEIGVISELFQSQMGGPALLFEEIPGYPNGGRILSNSMTSDRRLALTLGLPQDLSGTGLVQAIKGRFAEVQPAPVQETADGPVMENVQMRDDVDLLSVPVPKLHELDAGPYFGTGCVVIMRDPDSGWVNVGTYRVMLKDRCTCAMHIVEGRQGWAIRQKYWRSGKPCPVVVATGVDPLLYLMAGMELPWGQNEMEWAGGWQVEAVTVVTGPATGLPIPATAEIAVEGLLQPGDLQPEGPFGEWRGFYSREGKPEPVLQVLSLLHRDDPIMVASVPRVPPSDTTYTRGILRAALVWRQLEQAGVPGVTGAWIVPWGGDRPFLTLNVKTMYPYHATQAGLVAANCQAFNYGGSIVLVLDQDIDPTDWTEVSWALSTRLSPDTGIHVIPRTWGNPVFKSGTGTLPNTASRVVIDATVPWGTRQPPLVKPSAEWVARVMSKWPGLFANWRVE